MDERTLKRLAVIVAVSIVVIFLLRWGMTKTYTALNEAAAAKKQAAKPAATQQAPVAPAQPGETEASAASGEDEQEVGEMPPGSETDSEPQPAAPDGTSTE